MENIKPGLMGDIYAFIARFEVYDYYPSKMNSQSKK